MAKTIERDNLADAIQRILIRWGWAWSKEAMQACAQIHHDSVRHILLNPSYFNLFGANGVAVLLHGHMNLRSANDTEEKRLNRVASIVKSLGQLTKKNPGMAIDVISELYSIAAQPLKQEVMPRLFSIKGIAQILHSAALKQVEKARKLINNLFFKAAHQGLHYSLVAKMVYSGETDYITPENICGIRTHNRHDYVKLLARMGLDFPTAELERQYCSKLTHADTKLKEAMSHQASAGTVAVAHGGPVEHVKRQRRIKSEGSSASLNAHQGNEQVAADPVPAAIKPARPAKKGRTKQPRSADTSSASVNSSTAQMTAQLVAPVELPEKLPAKDIKAQLLKGFGPGGFQFKPKKAVEQPVTQQPAAATPLVDILNNAIRKRGKNINRGAEDEDEDESWDDDADKSNSSPPSSPTSVL